MERRATDPMHGYDLAPEDERLLRGRPPARALRWCAAAFGDGASVQGVAALQGGTSSAVHAVDVRDRRARLHRLVLRRFVRADWLADEPAAPRREAAALDAAATAGLPVPRLVALDADGREAGAPAVLMTRLPGAVEWRPADVDGFLGALAGLLPGIHAVRVPDDGAVEPYAPYRLRITRPPSWTARPGMWRRAFAVFEQPVPAAERCFIHRDYHPGNVLWSRGSVSGIVDWASAAAGSPDADVGHCRMNLARTLGAGAVERFLALHRRVSGRGPYDPYWDVVAAIGGFEDDDVERWTPAEEEFLARAVAAR
jgi:aminoglycoside phosphotransferase (APT) family kinase protein